MHRRLYSPEELPLEKSDIDQNKCKSFFKMSYVNSKAANKRRYDPEDQQRSLLKSLPSGIKDMK